MDFDGYMHNMYGYQYLSEEEKKDIDKLKEKVNNDTNYNINDEIDKIILKHFKSLDELHKFGLTLYFNKIKDYVIEKKLLPYLFYGADKNNNNRNYYTYTTLTSKNIILSRQSICYILLREYI